jgi:hypothetical protein
MVFASSLEELLQYHPSRSRDLSHFGGGAAAVHAVMAAIFANGRTCRCALNRARLECA